MSCAEIRRASFAAALKRSNPLPSWLVRTSLCAAASLIGSQCLAVDVPLAAANSNATNSAADAGSVDLSASNLSLRQALAVLAAPKAQAKGAGSIDSLNLVLGAGVYRLSDALKIQPDPSWKDTPITITGAGVGKTVISGSRPVNGFAPVSDPAILARLPASARGHVLVADLARNGITDLGDQPRHGFGIAVTPAPLELFYRDQPMTSARWPSTGFATIAQLPDGENGRTFTVKGAPTEAWRQEPQLEATGYWARDWADITLPVESIDASGQITLQAPAPQFGMKVGQRVFFDNVLAELNQPGLWYLDRAAGRVYFWPPAPLHDGEVEASVANALMVITNVSHLRIRQLTLTAGRGNALEIRGGHDVVVEHVAIRNMGDRAAFMTGTNSGFRFVTVENTGEGGLAVFGGSPVSLAPGGMFVEDSEFDHYARRSRSYRPAINIAGAGDRVVRNHIHDGPHAGIIFGGNNHLIADNEIDHVAQESGDTGAIYAGRDWTARGTVIENNFFHDIGSAAQPSATMGIYLDDEFGGTTIRRNVFARVNQAVFIGGGSDILVEDNLFVDCTPAVYIDSRGLSWQKVMAQDPQGVLQKPLQAVHFDQPPYSTQYPTLTTILSDRPGAPKNIILRRNAVVGGRATMIDARALPLIQNVAMFGSADVVFAHSMSDAARTRFSDFQVSPTSPALQQGFKVPGFDPHRNDN